MRRFVSPAILCFALTLVAACAPMGGSAPRSSGAPRWVSEPGRLRRYRRRRLSESPDRPIFFLFCAESP